MDDDTETYILLLLSDSNLPTGAFVASAGLESYFAHGFSSLQARSDSHSSAQSQLINSTTNFVRDNLNSYARAALPFVADAHDAAVRFVSMPGDAHNERVLDAALRRLMDLDDLYEKMTLNHVARRASQSQGVALLTLYSRGFSQPTLPSILLPVSSKKFDNDGILGDHGRNERATQLVDKLKFHVRRNDTHGHLPVCWGVLTAALGLPTARSQYLHMFLQARSLLSAAVRLNTIGPYAAQQLLLHAVRPMVEAEIARCGQLRTSGIPPTHLEHRESTLPEVEDTVIDWPATTWPLGEILATRHDLQHSRIFNS